jgi:hypothetical protein
MKATTTLASYEFKTASFFRSWLLSGRHSASLDRRAQTIAETRGCTVSDAMARLVDLAAAIDD